MDSVVQYLQSIQPEDLPSNHQTCKACGIPWGFPKDIDGLMEHPIILHCGCIAGSMCLERSFETSPQCPLCNTTISLIAGVDAPPNRSTVDHLKQLELMCGVHDWPIPSTEGRQATPDAESMEEDAQMRYDMQNKLGVLNSCHGTSLSERELEMCVSFVDYRLGTTTSITDVLDAFLKCPLFDPARWERSAEARANMEGISLNPLQDEYRVESAHGADLRAALMLINLRAKTSFLLDELDLVVSLMNYIHGREIGLLEVLGLQNGGMNGQPDLTETRPVDRELVRGFETLDIRVGMGNTMEDLGDVFSQVSF